MEHAPSDPVTMAIERLRDEFGVVVSEVKGPEPGWRLHAGDCPVFTGATRQEALGTLLAFAQQEGLIRGA